MSAGLTRRDLLRLGTAAAIAPAVPRWLRKPESFTFAFFSDTHVGLGRNIEENAVMLREVVDLKPDLAINGGDVTDYGWVGEYDAYRKLLDPLGFPVHHIAGNHDVRWSPLGPKAFVDGTRDPLFKWFTHKGCLFVLLDSTVPLSHWGHFESAMLRELEASLRAWGTTEPVFVFTHHWVGRDVAMVDNEDRLAQVLRPYNVIAIFNGHGHSDLLWQWNGWTSLMNKGLYQGSWQVIHVDQERNEARILRRTKAQEPTLVARVSLDPAARTAKRGVEGAVPWGEVVTGPVPMPVPEDAEGWEFQANDAPWRPVGEVAQVATTGYIRIRSRQDANHYFSGFVIETGDTRGVRLWERKLSGGVMSHVCLHDGRLYLSTMDGAVTCLDATAGKPVWTRRLGGYCHSSPVVVEHGGAHYVVVGSSTGRIASLHLGNGEVAWEVDTEGPVYGSAVYAQGVVAVGSGDGSIRGYDAATGKAVWRFDLPAGNTAFTQSRPASDGERFYFGAWDKNLYCLEARTGRGAWRADCVRDRKSFAFSPAIGGPVVGDGRVVVPANGNDLWCFEAATGKDVWKLSSPGDKFGYSQPRLADGRIYVGCLGNKGEVRCVDLAKGEIVWTAETGSVIYDSGPAVTPNYVVAGSVSGKVSAIHPQTGAVLGSYHLPPGHLLSTPAADGLTAYVASYCDRVFALRLDRIHG